MQTEEQKLIDDLFGRLQQAETQSNTRDSGAEQRIKQHIQAQPDAPYYMTQAIIIQEAALKKLNDRVSQLERQLAEQPKQSSGGFLSGLFGGGNSRPQTPAPQNSGWGGNTANPAPQGYAPAAQQPQAARSSGFLGGALQTAVGVAGGVVMADMLTSMFHHSQPEEIVNIINEPPLEQPNYDENLDTFNQSADAGDFNSNWDNNTPSNDDSSSFFGDSSFGDDDDSFL